MSVERTTLPAKAALERLKAGNARYVQNVRSIDSMLSHSHRGDLLQPQTPFAIILGCSDSRAPAEIVFLDDVEAAVAAARACGWHAVQFHDTAQAIAEIAAHLASAEG